MADPPGPPAPSSRGSAGGRRSPRLGGGHAAVYHWMAWRSLIGLLLGLGVLAAGYHGGILLAYLIEQGSIAGAQAPAGSSYLADDLHAAPMRSLATMAVATPIWSLIHYYGRRGPVMATAYALAVGWFGYLSFMRDAGPIDHLGQYLAYAAPTLAALMLAWRLAYRRE